MLFAFLAGAMVGAVKLAHVEWLRHDRVFTKFLRFSFWPVRKVFSAALESVTDTGVVALSWVLTRLGLRSVANATSAVLDFDSPALRCFGTQAGAVFGYCGKDRNRRRHHPLVASVAQTRAVVHAKYRDGSGIGEQESIAFIAESVSRLRGRLAQGAAVSVRADAGFWSRATGEWLVAQKVRAPSRPRSRPGGARGTPAAPRGGPEGRGEDGEEAPDREGRVPSQDEVHRGVRRPPSLRQVQAAPSLGAERNLRAQAVGRSNWLYAGNHQAAECAAVAYTLVQTAKLHGLAVRAYLTWALERVAAGRKDPKIYAALTPMAYEEAQKVEARGAGK